LNPVLFQIGNLFFLGPLALFEELQGRELLSLPQADILEAVECKPMGAKEAVEDEDAGKEFASPRWLFSAEPFLSLIDLSCLAANGRKGRISPECPSIFLRNGVALQCRLSFIGFLCRKQQGDRSNCDYLANNYPKDKPKNCHAFP
jgi:hypothetical protein